MAVQGIPHFRAKGVAGAEPARHRTGGDHRLPHRCCVVDGSEDLHAALPGVAGPTHRASCTRHLCGPEGHVLELRQSKAADQLIRCGSLDGDDGDLPGHIRHAEATAPEPFCHLGAVGSVGDQQELPVADPIRDEVVDHTAGLIETQRVLRLAIGQPAQVVGEDGVQDVERTADHQCAEMGDVEYPDRLPNGVVFGHHPGVLQGHRPTREVRELGAGGDVQGVQRALDGHCPTLSGGTRHRVGAGTRRNSDDTSDHRRRCHVCPGAGPGGRRGEG